MSNTLTLNNPMSESDWDKICDVELEETKHIWFETPSGKRVGFVKVDAIKQKINKELVYQWRISQYSDGYKDGILCVWKMIENIITEGEIKQMTPDRALDILMMSEQAHWNNGIDSIDVDKAVETIRKALQSKGDVLDKIRAEIEHLHYHPKLDFINTDKVVDMALEIIDKYKAESEDKQ